jgi:hypothetical protein
MHHVLGTFFSGEKFAHNLSPANIRSFITHAQAMCSNFLSQAITATFPGLPRAISRS